MKREKTIPEIWLEVSNIAFNPTGGANAVAVQLKGDQEDDRWLEVNGTIEVKPLMDAMKDKRPVHARLGVVTGGVLGVTELRVSFSATLSRSS